MLVFRTRPVFRSALVCLPLLAWAQTAAPAPPPEVDQALRERCTQFFQHHVTGDFRKAYEMVADDAKDFYFAGHKTQYKSFKIDSIKYSENFTKAKVQLTTELIWEIRTQKQVAKVQTFAAWKLQNGKWMWYDDPEDRWPTPMGPSDPNALNRNPDGSVQMPRDFSPDAIQKKAMDATQTLAKATNLDKNEVTFEAGKAGSDKVVLHNGAPGYVNLELGKGIRVPGLTFELDKVQVGPNQDATLKIIYQPVDKAAVPGLVKAQLTIAPFNQVFEVAVKIVAPEQ